MKNNRRYKAFVGLFTSIIAALSPLNVFALKPADYPLQNIDFYSSLATACQPVAASGGGGATAGNTKNDYKGNQIVTDDQLKKIQQNQSIYEQAATETKIPWQLLAVIHMRESGLSRSNPGNGQGIYQNAGGEGGPYPTGPVDDKEFLRQSIFAGNRIKEKADDKKDQLAAGDPEAVKYTLFGYNGRAAAYTRQAKELGFSNGYEGSPYVMNIADEKRDPAVNKTTWGQIKTDGGGLSYPAGSDYGAFVVYAALANIPSMGGVCAATGAVDPRVGANGWAVTGPNAMVLYYQYKDPWATQAYGNSPCNIKQHGCGPTSMSMVVATLKKDASVTPKVMADYFAANGGQIGGSSCGSTWELLTSSSVLAKKYGLEITNLGTDLSKVTTAIKRGSFVYMSQGPGLFTTGGHLMLIRGVTDGGNYLVADPNSEKNTTNETGFTSSDIRGGLMNLWEIRLKGA